MFELRLIALSNNKQEKDLIQREFSQFNSNLFCTELENRAKIKLDVARNGHILAEY